MVLETALDLGGDLLEDELDEDEVEVHEDWEDEEEEVSMVLIFEMDGSCWLVVDASFVLLAWILIGKWLLSAFLARMLDEFIGLKAEFELIGCCCSWLGGTTSEKAEDLL